VNLRALAAPSVRSSEPRALVSASSRRRDRSALPDRGPAAESVPGVAPTFFSSLEHIRRRSPEWGAEEFERRLAAAWERFVPGTRDWRPIVHGRGVTAVEEAYRVVLSGRVPPDEGHILSV
jgi:hypothetical protein